ncbi:MAG: hypothetical protein AAB839_00370 [Patescibacteria group bacterium]
MTTAVLLLIQVVVAIAIAPLVLGVAQFVASILRRTERVVPWRLYGTIIQAAKQGIVTPPNASWVYSFSPIVTLGCSLALLVLFPLITSSGILIGVADIFVVAGVFLFLETSNTLGRMERGLPTSPLVLSLIFTTIILAFVTIALYAGSVNVMDAWNASWQSAPILLCAIGALFLLVLAGRLAHANHSRNFTGFFRATTMLAEGLQLTVLGVFITTLLYPFGLVVNGASTQDVAIAIGVFVLRCLVVSVIFGALEGILVDKRFVTSRNVLLLAALCSLVGLVLSVTTTLL